MPGNPASVATGLAIRVGGAVIEIDSGFNPDLLQAVVRALAAC